MDARVPPRAADGTGPTAPSWSRRGRTDPCGSEQTGPWGQISEPRLLTYALQRELLDPRLGPGLNLCLHGFLPPLPDSWVELWPQFPQQTPYCPCLPHPDPSYFSAPLGPWTSPEDPHHKLLCERPRFSFLFFFWRGEQGSWFQ